jgi:prepilin-type N-terminal cleavage/methylation domain-containing protein
MERGLFYHIPPKHPPAPTCPHVSTAAQLDASQNASPLPRPCPIPVCPVRNRRYPKLLAVPNTFRTDLFNSPGFTLTELLVVIGVITVLLAFLAPALNKAREQARQVQCLSNLKQVGAYSAMYAASNRGRLFPSHDPPRFPLLMFGKADAPFLRCPSDPAPYFQHSYLANTWAIQWRYWPATMKPPRGSVLLFGEKHHNAGGWLFAPGMQEHVWTEPRRHGRGSGQLFVDGSARVGSEAWGWQ